MKVVAHIFFIFGLAVLTISFSVTKSIAIEVENADTAEWTLDTVIPSTTNAGACSITFTGVRVKFTASGDSQGNGSAIDDYEVKISSSTASGSFSNTIQFAISVPLVDSGEDGEFETVSVSVDMSEEFSTDISIDVLESSSEDNDGDELQSTTITGQDLTDLNDTMISTCFVPTADAGINQTVDSGDVVTLSGSGTDNETSVDDLDYSWTQTSGTAVTLSDDAAQNPTFDTSELGLEAGGNSEVLAFQLTVIDEDGYASTNDATVQITVNSPPDTERPSVTLSDEPGTVAGNVEFDIVVRFSEEVEDVGTDDFDVTNGRVISVVSSGFGSAVYTATVLADDANGQDLEIFFVENGATDLSDVNNGDGNGNTVSNTLIVPIGSSEPTETAIREALLIGNTNLLNAQDSLTDFLNGEDIGGNTLLTVEPGLAILSARLMTENGGWAKIEGTYSDISDAETSYIHGTLGTHWFVTDNLLMGAMLQFDQSDTETAEGNTTKLTGWLLGPYIVGQMPGQNLYYETRLLAGQGAGDVEMASTGYTGSFDTERLLIKGKLEGEYDTNWATLRPFLSFAYVKTTSEGFTDSGDITVPSQSVETQQGELGLTARIAVDGSSVLIPGLSAVTSNSEGGEDDNGRVKLSLGFYKEFGSGSLDIGTFYDGLGQDNFESYGANLQFNWKF